MKALASNPVAYCGNRNAGGYAAMVVLAACAILFPLKDCPTEWAVYVIGVGGMAAVALALFVKYRGHWRLNSEIVFILGLSLQYLVAPTLLALATGNFEHFGNNITVERREVKEGYPGAMLVVMCFVGAFLTTSCFIQRGDPRFITKQIATFSFGSVPFTILLAAVLWITRLILLATGSYYHLNRSDFQVEDSRYSLLAQMDFTLSVIVTAYALSLYLIRGRGVLLPVIIYLLIDFIWNFFSGSRERALTVMVCLIITYIVSKNRLPLKFVAVCGVLSLFLIGYMDFYRYAVANATEASKLELSAIEQALHSALHSSKDSGVESTVVAGLSRLSDLESIAAIFLWTPSVVDFMEGETYQGILAGLVPRFLWPDKPPTIMPINKWFFTGEGGSSPTTTIGEGYLNFGWTGVILAGIFSALALHFTERFLFRFYRSSLFVPTYVLLLITLSRLHTQPAAIWVTVMIKTCLIMWVAATAIRVIERMLGKQQLKTDAPVAPALLKSQLIT